MDDITINAASETGETSPAVFDALQRRAYELFAASGFLEGHDLDNWLTAERELMWIAPAEVIDEGAQFRLVIAAPGLACQQITIKATPDSIKIEGEQTETAQTQEDGVFRDEYREHKVSREVPFPAPVDPAEVSATLANGELTIIAPKDAAKPERGKPSKSARKVNVTVAAA